MNSGRVILLVPARWCPALLVIKSCPPPRRHRKGTGNYATGTLPFRRFPTSTLLCRWCSPEIPCLQGGVDLKKLVRHSQLIRFIPSTQHSVPSIRARSRANINSNGTETSTPSILFLALSPKAPAAWSLRTPRELPSASWLSLQELSIPTAALVTPTRLSNVCQVRVNLDYFRKVIDLDTHAGGDHQGGFGVEMSTFGQEGAVLGPVVAAFGEMSTHADFLVDESTSVRRQGFNECQGLLQLPPGVLSRMGAHRSPP
jgi:hypothetical protein